MYVHTLLATQHLYNWCYHITINHLANDWVCVMQMHDCVF